MSCLCLSVLAAHTTCLPFLTRGPVCCSKLRQSDRLWPFWHTFLLRYWRQSPLKRQMGTAGTGKASEDWVGWGWGAKGPLSLGLESTQRWLSSSTPQGSASCTPCCREEPGGTSGAAAEGQPIRTHDIRKAHLHVSIEALKQLNLSSTHHFCLWESVLSSIPEKKTGPQKGADIWLLGKRYLCLRCPMNPFCFLGNILFSLQSWDHALSLQAGLS